MFFGCSLAMLSAVSSIFAENFIFPISYILPTEAGWLTFLFGAFLCAISLLLAARRYPRFVRSAILHPLTLLFSVLSIASLAFSPFHMLPALTLTGHPFLGEGAATFLGIAILMASAFVIFRAPTVRWGLAAVFLSLFCIEFLIYVLGPKFFGVSLSTRYVDFLGTGILAACGVIAGLSCSRSSHPSPSLKVLICVAGMAAVFLSFVISNMTAIVCSVLFLGGAAANFIQFNGRFRRWENFVVFGGALGSAAVPTAILALFPDITDVSSVAGRQPYFAVAHQAFLQNPLQLLTGFGWGHSTDLMALYGPVHTAIASDVEPHFRGVAGAWEGVRYVHPHLHNNYLEWSVSLGILGLVCAFAFPILLATTVYRSFAVVAFCWAVIVYLTFWFQTVEMLAFFAISLAAVMRRCKPISRALRPLNGERIIPVALIIIVIATFFVRSTPDQIAWHTKCDYLGSLENRGGYVHWVKGLSYLREAPADAVVPALETMKEATVCGQSTFLLQSLWLEWAARSYFLLDEDSSVAKAALVSGWDDVARETLRRTPLRNDLLISYFSMKIDREEYEDVLRIVDDILSSNPENSVALWFKGIALLTGGGDPLEGARTALKALDFGVRDYLPIDKTTENQLQGMVGIKN